MWGFEDGQYAGFNPSILTLDCTILKTNPDALPCDIKLFTRKNYAIEAMMRRLKEIKDE